MTSDEKRTCRVCGHDWIVPGEVSPGYERNAIDAAERRRCPTCVSKGWESPTDAGTANVRKGHDRRSLTIGGRGRGVGHAGRRRAPVEPRVSIEPVELADDVDDD